MKRGKPLERRTEMARTEMKRVATLTGTRAEPPKRRKAVSPATPAQRAKVRHLECIACAGLYAHGARCQPAHLIARGFTTLGQDDPLAVVPLCPHCHRVYDDELGLDLLPYLEPAWRAELAFAVMRVGLVTTYRRVTNTREVE